MNTYKLITAMTLCILHASVIPLAFGKENPEAQTIFTSFPSLKVKNAQVHKLILHHENQHDFLTSFNIIEPRISSQANRSKKKDAIMEAIDEGTKDMAQYFKENRIGTFNEYDAEYAQYYSNYVKWKNAEFNIVYVITKSKKHDDLDILGVVLGYSAFKDDVDAIAFKKTYPAEQLQSLQWTGSFGGSLVDAITSMILRKDAEDITTLPTKPSRFQSDERERNRFSSIAEKAPNDIDVYQIGEADFQLIHAALTPPNPRMSDYAAKSKKKDAIMEAIDEGEADIASFLKMNGSGNMNMYDREFAKYHEMLVKYTSETFESAYVITKRNAKKIEILGLILGNACMPPAKSADCLQNTKKIFLTKELTYYGVGSEQISMPNFLQKIIQKNSCSKVYP
ncbi:MAG: hypothetical protein ACO3YM_02685 [Candidatus Kapaibacteriota bacterium]